MTARPPCAPSRARSRHPRRSGSPTRPGYGPPGDTDTQTRTVSATDGIVLEPLQPQQDSYVEGYVDGYESGYQRKLSMFEDPYYVRPASYYNYYYDTAYFLDGIYGPGYYDVSLVAGNLVVTPVYLTPWNNWGFWGSPYYWWSPGFYFGSYYSPYWGWGWNWGFNWYWGWDYWYPHYAPYPPHHHGPYYSYRPHSSTNSSYRYGSSHRRAMPPRRPAAAVRPAQVSARQQQLLPGQFRLLVPARRFVDRHLRTGLLVDHFLARQLQHHGRPSEHDGHPGHLLVGPRHGHQLFGPHHLRQQLPHADYHVASLQQQLPYAHHVAPLGQQLPYPEHLDQHPGQLFDPEPKHLVGLFAQHDQHAVPFDQHLLAEPLLVDHVAEPQHFAKQLQHPQPVVEQLFQLAFAFGRCKLLLAFGQQPPITCG